eukprot:CAMPEP_0197825310 /NCGR_PEP_ID=MMETSP1437-20131217/2408_1 /TAXON_ID=49252 ORGANISM="Eucampia antarctica, Strain CCMP1452" /NCGR_SAMPLE_ID=MMETSP1437 /ASSEMBLY_ACC=CAM_ASM_001096 /LENGTH=175 /DNA_ID=CAMNT_0043425245 /DNA_START=18 /DNA_END=545 /DNA_ORIENTATION=+
MVLRAPGDLINLLTTILGFHQNGKTVGFNRAADTMHQSAKQVVLKARDRRMANNNSSLGRNGVVTVQLENAKRETDHQTIQNKHARDDSSIHRTQPPPPPLGSMDDMLKRNGHFKKEDKKQLHTTSSSSTVTTPISKIKSVVEPILHSSHGEEKTSDHPSDEDDNDDTGEGFIRF